MSKNFIVDESYLIQDLENNDKKADLIIKLVTIKNYLIDIQKNYLIDIQNNQSIPTLETDFFKLNKNFYRISDLNKEFFEENLSIASITDLDYNIKTGDFKLNYTTSQTNNIPQLRSELNKLGFTIIHSITNNEIKFEFKVFK